MPVSVGETFAGYTILRVLGAGGMGTVYLAAHPRLPRQDALKVLPSQWTADPQYRERFLREADLTASLSHPNILGVHDRGEHDGQLWISMDYVGGTDASKLVREHHPEGLAVSQALEIVTAAKTEIGFEDVAVNEDVAKVSVIGVGMRSHAGVAKTMFTALAEKGVNIQVISTSEIKISVLIDAAYTELAVRALHAAYGLDQL